MKWTEWKWKCLIGNERKRERWIQEGKKRKTREIVEWDRMGGAVIEYHRLFESHSSLLPPMNGHTVKSMQAVEICEEITHSREGKSPQVVLPFELLLNSEASEFISNLNVWEGDYEGKK